MISAFSDSASARPRALFPDAVGPRIARTFSDKLQEDVHSQCHEEDDEAKLLDPGRHEEILSRISLEAARCNRT